MKVQVSEATPSQLNWLVAKCKGIEVVAVKEGRATFSDPTDDGALNEMPINYSTDWGQGGPIIEQERIELRGDGDEGWIADDNLNPSQWGPTPLIAAMRCYVASHLGVEVEIPEELT